MIDDTPILAPAPRTEPVRIPGRDPIPVTLLTGFLGAGKTTLLNRILNGQHGLRVGVLVNDFGAINIDAELVAGVEKNMITLTNGCICCEIRDDLIQSLEQLLLRPEVIDYVLLEASGVADPEGIVMTFLDQRYEQLLRLDSITCVIDSEAVFADGDNEGLNRLKLRQIGLCRSGHSQQGRSGWTRTYRGDSGLDRSADTPDTDHPGYQVRLYRWKSCSRLGASIQRTRYRKAQLKTHVTIPTISITLTGRSTHCSKLGATNLIGRFRSKPCARWFEENSRHPFTGVRGSCLPPTPPTSGLPFKWWDAAQKSLS